MRRAARGGERRGKNKATEREVRKREGEDGEKTARRRATSWPPGRERGEGATERQEEGGERGPIGPEAAREAEHEGGRRGEARGKRGEASG